MRNGDAARVDHPLRRLERLEGVVYGDDRTGGMRKDLRELNSSVVELHRRQVVADEKQQTFRKQVLRWTRTGTVLAAASAILSLATLGTVLWLLSKLP